MKEAAAAAAAKAAEALPIDTAKPEEETAPTCPFCLEEHKAGATRCPHCGSALPVDGTGDAA